MSLRPIFLRQPWWVRLSRWNRRRVAESMAIPRTRDPSERPLSIYKIAFVTAVICAVGAAFYIGESVERKRQRLMDGLYNPTPPAPRARLDCSPEGREICKGQARLGRVKQL